MNLIKSFSSVFFYNLNRYISDTSSSRKTIEDTALISQFWRKIFSQLSPSKNLPLTLMQRTIHYFLMNSAVRFIKTSNDKPQALNLIKGFVHYIMYAIQLKTWTNCHSFYNNYFLTDNGLKKSTTVCENGNSRLTPNIGNGAIVKEVKHFNFLLTTN